jgi:hypothetical protein
MKCLRNVAVALCAKRVLSSHDQGCHVPERAEGANAQEELSSLGAHELVLRNKQVDKRLGCVILTQAEEPVGADALHLNTKNLVNLISALEQWAAGCANPLRSVAVLLCLEWQHRPAAVDQGAVGVDAAGVKLEGPGFGFEE